MLAVGSEQLPVSRSVGRPTGKRITNEACKQTKPGVGAANFQAYHSTNNKRQAHHGKPQTVYAPKLAFKTTKNNRESLVLVPTSAQLADY